MPSISSEVGEVYICLCTDSDQKYTQLWDIMYHTSTFELHTCKSSSPGEALLCVSVFDITPVHWVQHWYCCNAVPSFSAYTYDIPLREALRSSFGSGALCAVPLNAVCTQ